MFLVLQYPDPHNAPLRVRKQGKAFRFGATDLSTGPCSRLVPRKDADQTHAQVPRVIVWRDDHYFTVDGLFIFSSPEGL